MRARIDITEAEADTKIRGKYLRALENEEWRLLPGPTFVRSFLRTYGDYLGLDGRLLVEDFKLRYEQSEDAPRPIAGPAASASREGRRRGCRIRRARTRAGRRRAARARWSPACSRSGAARRRRRTRAPPPRRRRRRSRRGRVATLRIQPPPRSTHACARSTGARSRTASCSRHAERRVPLAAPADDARQRLGAAGRQRRAAVDSANIERRRLRDHRVAAQGASTPGSAALLVSVAA